MRPDPARLWMAIVGAISAIPSTALPAAALAPSPAFHGAPDGRCDHGSDAQPCATGVPRGARAQRLVFTSDGGSGVDSRRKPVRVNLAAQHRETGPSAVFLACMDHADGVTSAMLECGRAEIDRVDARLNAAYRRLMTTLPAADAVRLHASQRAWLRHHLTETRRLAGAPDTGSLAFVDSQRFELQDLGERTILLERMLARHH